MLAEAEVAAFFWSDQDVSDQLLETAWNLHHVGTVRPQLAIYEPTRQVQANAVAAHIFDLALQKDDLDPGQQLVLTFAGQVSAIRGDRTPNATAMGRRLPSPSAALVTEPGRASLELGCALLKLDRSATLKLLRSLSTQAQAISLAAPNADLFNTGLASAAGVIEGVRLLQEYLTFGRPGSLDEARHILTRAAKNPASHRDLDSRWVAAHLVDLCDEFGVSSIWAILPDNTPDDVGQAMTLGDPPVMTLWPPQVNLLADAASSPLHQIKCSDPVCIDRIAKGIVHPVTLEPCYPFMVRRDFAALFQTQSLIEAVGELERRHGSRVDTFVPALRVLEETIRLSGATETEEWVSTLNTVAGEARDSLADCQAAR